MAHDNAAQFLAWVVPWPLPGADPPEFFVNIHAPIRFKDRAKPAWGGRACTTLREALNYIDYIKRRRAEQTPDDSPSLLGDIYVCMSAQRRAHGKTDKRGRAYYTAARGDLNALWHKSFFIDVDTKFHGKQTRARFAKFLLDTGLPFPTFMVASGTPDCFHAHWVVHERIETDRWLQISQWLVTAMRVHEFVTDYGPTVDSVRVMRVPDTFNYKTDPPNPVLLKHAADSMFSLASIEQRLEPYRAVTPPQPQRQAVPRSAFTFPTGFGPISTHAGPATELAPNQGESLPTLAEAARGCPLVGKAVDTHGAEFPEPLWFETVKLAYYLREGEAAAHEMSRGYDGYSVEETRDKFEIERQKRWPVDNWGWPKCDQIKTAGSDRCASCRWMIAGETSGRSPLNFIGRDSQQLPVETPPVTPEVTTQAGEELVPPGYILKNYLFYKEPSLEDADEKTGELLPPQLVMPFLTREYRLSEDHWLYFEQFLNDRWHQVTIDCADINDTRSFAREAGKKAGWTFDDALLARKFMVSFVQLLRERKDRIIPTDSNGWSVVDGMEVAWTYGRVRYNGTADIPSHLSDKNLQELYAPTGSIEPFLRAVQMIKDQGRPVLDVAIATSFGTPFMHFTGQHGVILSLRGETSHGKSSVIKVCQSTWGDPKTQIHSLDDTAVSINIHLAQLRHLPIFWDEVGSMEQSKTFVNTLFSLGQGKSKSRGDRSGTKLQAVHAWSTIMIAGTNYSIAKSAEAMGTRSEAGVYRIWEMEIPKRGADKEVENFAGIIRGIESNFGHAGARISSWLGPRASSLNDRVQSMQSYLRKDFGASDADRFRIALATCALMGAHVGNKVGVSAFDIPTMHAYLKSEFERNKRLMIENPVGIDKPSFQFELIASYINDRDTVKLRTNIFSAQKRGTPSGVVVIGPIPDPRVNKAVHVQIAQDTKKVLISRRGFLNHVKRSHPNDAQIILDEMIKSLGIVCVKRTLAAGTRLFPNQAQEWLLEIDRSELAELYDGETT